MPELRAGAAAVTLPVPLGRPLAGYGPGGGVGRTTRRPLEARVLTLDDGRARVALVMADLLSGGAALRRAVEAHHPGLPVVLAGTHTHTGPGGYMGQTLYDRLAPARPGFDPALTEALAAAVAEGIERARAGAVPARVGFGERRAFGLAFNADLEAFGRNPEASTWAALHGTPTGLDPRASAVDPRVRALAAFGADGRLVGALGWFAVHPTALGEGDAFDPDWPGTARREAEARLGAPIGIGASAAGDTNATGLGSAGPDLVERLGAAIGDALAQAIEAARADAEVAPLGVAIAGVPTAALPAPSFGLAALAGGEDGRSPLFRLGLVGAHAPGASFPPEHPQHPKRPVFGRAQPWVLRRLGLAAPAELPLAIVALGPRALATVPLEPTVTAAHRLERALLATGRKSAIVAGYALDYLGYLVTPEEYAAQGYEGASTLFGREALPAVERGLVSLARDLG